MDNAQGTGDGWVKAKSYASALGFVPSSFSTSIRTMVSDHIKNEASLKPVTKYQVSRLTQGPSFKSMFFFASQQLRHGYIKDQKSLSIGYMLDLYDAFDIAVMVGCFLMVRKWRKFIGLDKWNLFFQQCSVESQMGAQVGIVVPEIGLGSAFLMSTFEFLTLGAILKQDEKLVTRYLKERKSAPSREKLQQDIFGCSLHQVSTLLLCNMGYGADIANAYCLALDPKRTLDSNENGFLARMQVSRMWIEALMAGKSQPDQKLSARFFPMESVRGELDRNIGQIREGLPHWIARSKDDISATATPQLFAKPEKSDSEIPPELQAVFSVDEISNMDVDAFDQLIDQLDYEKDGGKPPAGMVVMSAKDLKEIDGIVE